jgi:hypothetical protein
MKVYETSVYREAHIDSSYCQREVCMRMQLCLKISNGISFYKKIILVYVKLKHLKLHRGLFIRIE